MRWRAGSGEGTDIGLGQEGLPLIENVEVNIVYSPCENDKGKPRGLEQAKKKQEGCLQPSWTQLPFHHGLGAPGGSQDW